MPQARRRSAATSRRSNRSNRDDQPQVRPQIDTEDIAQLQAGRLLVIGQLEEAHAAEAAGVTTLRAHVAMTPEGPYRKLLDRHLSETRDQAEKLQRRLGELGANKSVIAATYAAATTVVGQALALSKAPIDVIRGRAGDEKLFKNAKDEVATEAQEIATYDGIEATARAVGDVRTAELAVAIRGQEERQLTVLRELIPKLANATVRAIVAGDATYDASSTGAGQAVSSLRDEVIEGAEELRDELSDQAEKAADTAKATADHAMAKGRKAGRKAAGTAKATADDVKAQGRKAGRKAEKAVEGPNASELPIKRYDSLTAAEITSRLGGLSAADLRKVEAYERRHEDRSTVTDRIDTLKDHAK